MELTVDVMMKLSQERRADAAIVGAVRWAQGEAGSRRYEVVPP